MNMYCVLRKSGEGGENLKIKTVLCSVYYHLIYETTKLIQMEKN